jgi:hypothetical protein
MPDPISRLEFARQEVDRSFGPNYAAEHSDVVTAVMKEPHHSVQITRPFDLARP